jgi:hypothetical protein
VKRIEAHRCVKYLLELFPELHAYWQPNTGIVGATNQLG